MKNKKVKNIILIIILIVGLFGVSKFAKDFGAGSYPNAEIYEINAPEDKVLKAIYKLKDSQKDFLVPRVTFENKDSSDLSESEGRKYNSYWNFNYFYYSDQKKIILTWTRPNYNMTDFAFVSINDGLDIGHWKDINRDFGFFENRKKKKEFETRILKPIKEILKENK
jgi:hypothetical protein